MIIPGEFDEPSFGIVIYAVFPGIIADIANSRPERRRDSPSRVTRPTPQVRRIPPSKTLSTHKESRDGKRNRAGLRPAPGDGGK